MSDYEPELGQLCFGNPPEEYQMPLYAIALFDAILEEIGRIFWNINQKKWDRYTDPEIPDITFRPYYWGEDEKLMDLPNFIFKEVKIKWYKYPGRGMSCNVNWISKQWVKWFDKCMDILSKYEQGKDSDETYINSFK